VFGVEESQVSKAEKSRQVATLIEEDEGNEAIRIEFDIPKENPINQSDYGGIQNEEIQIEFEPEVISPENAEIESTSHQSLTNNSPIVARMLNAEC